MAFGVPARALFSPERSSLEASKRKHEYVRQLHVAGRKIRIRWAPFSLVNRNHDHGRKRQRQQRVYRRLAVHREHVVNSYNVESWYLYRRALLSCSWCTVLQTGKLAHRPTDGGTPACNELPGPGAPSQHYTSFHNMMNCSH